MNLAPESAHEKALLMSWFVDIGVELEDHNLVGWRFRAEIPYLPVMRQLLAIRFGRDRWWTRRPARYRPNHDMTWEQTMAAIDTTAIFIGSNNWHHFAFKESVDNANYLIMLKEGYTAEGLRKWLRTIHNAQTRQREENDRSWTR